MPVKSVCIALSYLSLPSLRAAYRAKASGNVFGPECLSVLEIQQYFSFWNPKKTLRQCCSKVHRKQYYYIFVEMTGVFKVNVSPFLSPPHTLCSAFSCTLSLSFPVCCECWRCQGASVFSVTTVIVKQWVQKGPLLFYSQKAEGRIYFTVIPSPTSPTLFCLPLPPQDIS